MDVAKFPNVYAGTDQSCGYSSAGVTVAGSKESIAAVRMAFHEAGNASGIISSLREQLATERARYAELVAVLRLWVKYDATAEDDGPTLENDYTAAITATCAALATLGPQS